MRTLKQPRAEATRERIVAAAAELFAFKGYHDTKLEEVHAQAGVTTGAFFHHFRSKEDLGFAAIDRHMEKRRARLDDIMSRVPKKPDDNDPFEWIVQRLDAIQEMIRQRGPRKGGCIIGNLSTSLADTHEPFRKRLAKCFEEMAVEFRPYLDAAMPKRTPRPVKEPLDTADLARYIVTVIEGAIMLSRTRHDRRLVAQHFDHLKRYLRQVLSA
jgi:TetR/AcrR family transcriptional repressor of nem operon